MTFRTASFIRRFIAALSLTVTPIEGEAGRYHVQSRSRPDQPNLVDLAEFGGRGQCSCPGWQTVRWPVIRDGCPIGDLDSQCAHIIAARICFANHLLADMARAESRP